MTIPAGSWDKTYDSSLATTPVDQGWDTLVGAPDPVFADGYLQLVYEPSTGASSPVLELTSNVQTLGARFRILEGSNPPANEVATVMMVLGYDTKLVYLLIGEQGAKVTFDGGSTLVPLNAVDYTDGGWHEAFIQWDPGTGQASWFLDGASLGSGAETFDLGTTYGQTYVVPYGNYGDMTDDPTVQIDWVVTSHDEIIAPPSGAPFGEASISLGAAGVTVLFDELALYAAPLDVEAIRRHYQAGKGMAS